MDNLAQTLLCMNGCKIDLQHGSVNDQADHPIALGPQATEVLRILAANPGQIVTTEDLTRSVSQIAGASEDSLMQCVIEIRKALGDDNHQIVRAGMKRGYVLEAAAIDTSNKLASAPTSTRRYSWLFSVAGLALLVGGAGLLWQIPDSEAERPAIASSLSENLNTGSTKALTEPALNETFEVTAPVTSTKPSGVLSGLQKTANADELAPDRSPSMQSVPDATPSDKPMNAPIGKDLAQQDALVEQRRRYDQLASQMVRMREAAETSMTEAKQALDRERQRGERLEREIAIERRSLDGLTASARVAETEMATDTRLRRSADAALVRTKDSLLLERSRADSLTRDLGEARQLNDVLKNDIFRISSALRDELAQARNESTGLARDLASARARIDSLTVALETRKISPKARFSKKDSQQSSVSAPSDARLVRQSRSKAVATADVRKTKRPARLNADALPFALLPTQRPLNDFQ